MPEYSEQMGFGDLTLPEQRALRQRLSYLHRKKGHTLLTDVELAIITLSEVFMQCGVLPSIYTLQVDRRIISQEDIEKARYHVSHPLAWPQP